MANLNFTGRVSRIGETKSGEGTKGPWTSTNFLVEEEGEYPNSIVFSAFNKQEMVDKLTIGSLVDVSYNAKHSEYEGKLYNSMNVWKIEFKDGENVTNTPTQTTSAKTVKSQVDDDLPF